MNLRNIAEYTLEQLTKQGADSAQVSVSRGSADELNIDAGEFSLMRTLFNTDVSIKALCDGRKGTAAINQTDKESIDAAVTECITSARSGMQDDAERIAPFEGKEDFSDGALEPDTDALYDRMQEMMSGIKAEFPKVMMESFIAKYSRGETLYINTNGTEFGRKSGHYSTMFTVSSHEGEASSSFNYYGHLLTALDRPFLDLDMTRILLRESELSIDTRSVDGKFVGDIILTPPCLDSILNDVIGNFAGDGVTIDGTGLWRDMVGKSVASTQLNLDFAPHDPRIVNGERFAGGFKSYDMSFIKDGVLQNLDLSDYAARKTGKKRASVYNPYNCKIVQPGNVSFDDMIKGIERGLIVGRFSGGSPAQNGDFSGVAKNSFLVEKGKVVGAVSETMISGNLAELMKSIVAISKEIACDGTGVLPWMQFGGVTVSGK